MAAVVALWLPILLSSVAVFFASSIIHMLSPWHKSDYAHVPDHAAVDLVVGTQRFHHVPDYLDQIFTRRREDADFTVPARTIRIFAR